MPHRFFLVDVYAERPYSGNQLAVVVTQESMPDETMQLLAAETNFSETTVVTTVSEEDGGYRSGGTAVADRHASGDCGVAWYRTFQTGASAEGTSARAEAAALRRRLDVQ